MAEGHSAVALHRSGLIKIERGPCEKLEKGATRMEGNMCGSGEDVHESWRRLRRRYKLSSWSHHRSDFDASSDRNTFFVAHTFLLVQFLQF